MIKLLLRKSLVVLSSLALVSSVLVPALSADADVTTVACSDFGILNTPDFQAARGFITIENNVVTGNTLCEGEVIIPEGVTSIGYNAFGVDVGEVADKLISVSIPSTVTSIGDWAFSDMPFLKNLQFDDIESSQLVTIGEWAFSRDYLLASFIFPPRLARISESAFYWAGRNVPVASATSIEIPSSVQRIDDNAFEYSGFADVTFSAGSQLERIGRAAFQDSIKMAESLEIPASVNYLGEFAFKGLTSLKKVTFLGNEPDTQADAFKNAAIGATVEVESWADGFGAGNLATWQGLIFVRAPARAIVVIPEGVTYIRGDAFKFDTSLTSITLPSTLASLGDNAFESDPGSAFRVFTFAGNAPSVGTDVFKNVSGEVRVNFAATGFDDTTLPSSDPGYRKWSGLDVVRAAEVTYSITYYLDGGLSALPTHEAVPYGTRITLADSPIRSGYDFRGWSDGSDLFAAGADCAILSDRSFIATWALAAAITPNPNSPVESFPVNETTPTPTPTPSQMPARAPILVPVSKVASSVFPITRTPVLLGVALSKPIFFDVRSAKLNRIGLATLRKLATTLRSTSGDLLVTGFVSYRGTASPGARKLATSRAKAVAFELVQLGIDVQISYVGYGSRNAVLPTSSDRRVELRWVAAG